MKLIKHEVHAKNGTTPRWVYETDNSFIKTIPYFPGPLTTVKKQIELINKVCDFKFIINYRIEERSEIWKNNHNEPSNLYLTYQMEKLNWLYSSSGKKLTKLDHIDPAYKSIDGLLEHILPLYVKLNLEIFPYGNFDLSYNNIMVKDNSDPCFIDWDDCILGNDHSSSNIGNHLIKGCADAHCTQRNDIGKEQIRQVLLKTIDVYRKLTYNTKLSELEFNMEEAIDYIYNKWKRTLIREGRL